MAQHLDSIYITHYFSFAKNTDPVPRIFVQEGTTEAKKLVFCDCMSNLRYKDEDCMKDVTFIRSLPVLQAQKFYTHAIVLRALVAGERLSDT